MNTETSTTETNLTAARSAAAYAAMSATTPLRPFTIERRALPPSDVRIEILYTGVCHSDLHMARNEWGSSIYPIVPGHEIVGRVSAVGENVTNFKEGDLAAVGCMVDSCQDCASCADGLEQYCEKGLTLTYNSRESDGTITYGGYSDSIVVTENFVLHVSDKLELKATAPLLCAGITLYSPLRHWKAGPGMNVGIIGLGGLGHMGVKFAHAMGAKVTVITTSVGKEEDARRLGADDVLLSKDATALEKAANSFDLLMNTIPVDHDLNPYVALLKRDATMVIVGAIEPITHDFATAQIVLKRRSIAGSLIGGIEETQEMLDYCAEHHIVSDVEMIEMDQINEAYERMLKSDVKYRFVIDMASLKKAA